MCFLFEKKHSIKNKAIATTTPIKSIHISVTRQPLSETKFCTSSSAQAVISPKNATFIARSEKRLFPKKYARLMKKLCIKNSVTCAVFLTIFVSVLVSIDPKKKDNFSDENSTMGSLIALDSGAVLREFEIIKTVVKIPKMAKKIDLRFT